MSDVDRVVKAMEPRKREMAERIRQIVKRALPGSEEAVKWGAPTFLVRGKIVANIMNYSDHLNLGFFKGAMIKSRLLEGTGKGLRHIRIYSIDDIKEGEFVKLLKDAGKLV